MASIINAGTTTLTPIQITGDTSGILQLQTNGGITAVTIDTSQNVGIGVTPSAWTLKAVQNGNAAFWASAANAFLSANLYYGSGGRTYITNGYSSELGLSLGGFQFQISGSGTAGGAVTQTQAMTLDNSGNLLINETSSVLGKLEVAINDTSSTQYGINIRGSGTGAYGGYLSWSDTWSGDSYRGAIAAVLGYRLNTGAGALRFFTANSSTLNEVGRFDNSGNLGIGTFTNYAAVNLYLGTSTAGSTAQGGISFAGGGTATFDTGHASGTASGATYQRYIYNGSVIGSITQNGTTGVLYNLTSDYRLKNNPVPVTGAKDFVMALQPKTWDWWDGSGKGVGFIAHEFMEIAKYSGHGEKDAVDADGKPMYQSIQPSSSEVMANLVAYIQELSAQVTALQTEVAQLQGAK